MEREKTVIHEYEVYHRLMRDAQVYIGDSLSDDIDLNDEKHQGDWRDFPGDPIVDVVFARSEYEAIKEVAEETGYHESNLYAVEHVVDAKVSTTGIGSDTDSLNGRGRNGRSTEFRITGTSYDDGRLSGIEVTMPAKVRVFLGFDRMDNQWKALIMDAESDDVRKVWDMDLSRI